MSPVLHTQKQGSFWLLFGSGGETVPGNLYIISLSDLNDYIKSDLTNSKSSGNRLEIENVIKPSTSRFTFYLLPRATLSLPFGSYIRL